MQARFNTGVIKQGAMRFQAASQEMRANAMQIGKIAASLTQTSWKGRGARAFEELTTHLQQDSNEASTAFGQVAQELNALAVQLDSVNQLHVQADRVEDEIESVERQLRHTEDPSRRASLRTELSQLRYRQNSILADAQNRERYADKRAQAKFDEIGHRADKLHYSTGVPERLKPGSQVKFEWSDLLLPSGIAGLMISKGIKFRHDPRNPKVVIISTAEWMRGQSRFQWWNKMVKGFNKVLVKVPGSEKTVARTLKDLTGISANLTRIGINKIPWHMAKRAVGPASIVFTISSEVKPLTESWKNNSKTAESREEFWKNFGQDAASSVNRILFKSLGAIGGTAAGATAGSLASPAGTIVGGAVGSVLGEKAGEWVAEQTDWIARKAGEKAGAGIAKALNTYDSVKDKIKGFDWSLGF
ncbi:hypothetical protein OS242_09795 [Tumebacillus sp. DT12]|uniref:WXG100 family type VII secretion target n=1 Tax=Tumebacillus lacus TaxID=2995335 RepID=A0ABT3X030_9BACL|nr:hypothetical protein [Tumebacillus lacus]MCX7570254.1 hypothetical protein [Tumebacillus lacus]